MALMLGHHVDRQAVGDLHRVAERLLDRQVRRAGELAVRVHFVARVEPHEHVHALRDGAALDRAHQLAQHVRVMRIQRPGRRRQRDELP